MTEEIDNTKKAEKIANSTKSKDKSSKRDKMKPLTKVVIRRLPPTMTEEEFLKQIDPLPDHEYYYYVPADWSLGQDATCRAYINFTKSDDIFLFKDRFDGYVFVDSKGAEYPAVVEYAPFQGLPRNKSRKRDPKCNTIEGDQHFLNFLESLKENEENAGKSDVKLEFSLQSKDDKKMITSTPLLQYLANKKQERRDERKRKLEEKRRQREEERQRKRNQVAKNVPPPIKEEDSKTNKDNNNSFKNKEKEDAKKDAKAKRRAMRDMKRKQEREKRNGSGQDKNSEEGNNSNNNQEKDVDKSDSQEKFGDKNDDKKKEVKKYSQTRRSRNEARKSESTTVEPSTSLTSQNAAKEKDVKEFKENRDEDKGEISESVKEFIKSVANIKEFIPRSRAIMTNADLESSIKPSSASSSSSSATTITKTTITTTKNTKEVDMSEVRDKLEKIAIAERGDAKKHAEKTENDNSNLDNTKSKSVSQDISPENGARDSSCSGTDKNDKGKDKDNRIVRRIRNKDRPSIEIYQPGKLRMKKDDIKDGRSSAELKDYKSNPTSDCESIKKEKDEKDSVRRKVIRYSEWRSSRAKEKSLRDEKEAVDTKEITVSSSEIQIEEKIDQKVNLELENAENK